MKKFLSGLLILVMLIMPLSVLPSSAADSLPTLTTDKTVYIEGEPIMVTFTPRDPSVSDRDWIGIYIKKHSDAGSIYWSYVADLQAGQPYDITDRANDDDGAPAGKDVLLQHANIPAGEYMICYMPNNKTLKQADPLVTVNVTVQPDPTPVQPPKAPSAVTYTLDDPTSGMADGTLTITLPEGHGANDIYMWWGNDAGKLPGYTRLARFKVTGNTVTHKMTPNTLIPAGATKLLIYTNNDRAGISETCFTLDLPAGAASADFGKPLAEFQVVSDIHIKGNASHLYSQHFVSMLKDVVKNSPDTLGIFTAGDNVDNGVDDYWNYFEQHYKSVAGAPPMYLGIGNHEHKFGSENNYKNGLAAFLEHLSLPDGTTPDKPYYDIWVGGYHFVYIGSESYGSKAIISNAQLDWLDETLAQNRDGKPIFLFCHQPMKNTTSGSSDAEGWSGIDNPTPLLNVLKKYPEVVMFNGHTHWILDSDNCMYDSGEEGFKVFNTSSVAYLWHSYYVATGETMEGSEGYYVRVYPDKIAVLGRNFVTGEWVSSAQFVIPAKSGSAPEETTPAPADTTSAPADTTPAPADTTPAPADTTPAPADTTPAPAGTTPAPADTTPAPASSGCGGALAPAALIGSILGACLCIRSKKRRNK